MGAFEQRELHHERDDIRAFYSRFSGEVIVGIEACGYTNWFEELIEGLGYKLLVGDAAEVRRLARYLRSTLSRRQLQALVGPRPQRVMQSCWLDDLLSREAVR